MKVNILKEVGIVILILIIIALLLGIILYDFIPKNKVIPKRVDAYTIPQEIKEELQNASAEEENIIKTYLIDSDTLDSYESKDAYESGKKNPFSIKYTEGEDTTTNNTNSVINVSEGKKNNTLYSNNSLIKKYK